VGIDGAGAGDGPPASEGEGAPAADSVPSQPTEAAAPAGSSAQAACAGAAPDGTGALSAGAAEPSLRSVFLSPFEPPEDFKCPLTLELMRDPVVTEDGQSYERDAITRWLQEHDTSPGTGDPLESKRLIPNIRLRSAIRDWLAQHGLS